MPISVPSSSPPPAPAPYLFGAEARVFHEGLLYHKPTFLRPFRPVAALLRSTQLRLTDYATSQLRSYSLRDASLSTHVNSRRLIITLADSARLVFQAPSPADFEHWRLSITDVVQWRFDHFYSLEHQLGKGAFATVHRARYLETGDVTAVKVVPVESLCPDDWKYLQTELDVARLAKHPNVVMALDLFQSRQFVHIVLELVPGGTLRDFVARHGPLSEKIARPILADVLRAVLYIHELGFVHRDLKVRHFSYSIPFLHVPYLFQYFFASYFSFMFLFYHISHGALARKHPLYIPAIANNCEAHRLWSFAPYSALHCHQRWRARPRWVDRPWWVDEHAGRHSTFRCAGGSI